MIRPLFLLFILIKELFLFEKIDMKKRSPSFHRYIHTRYLLEAGKFFCLTLHKRITVVEDILILKRGYKNEKTKPKDETSFTIM